MELIGLCLVDSTNQYQQALRAEAEAAAATAGLGLQTYFCEGDYARQITRLGEWLQDEQHRPAALMVMAVRDRGLDGLVRRAARAGVHVFFLNQTEDPLDEVRRAFPDVIVSQVCVDEEETGRIQGRIVRSLLPAGGRILLVEGTRRSLTARGRTTGLQELLHGLPVEMDRLEAGWSEEEGAAAAGRWLSIAMRCGRHLDLVVCHNDSLAVGVRRAIDATAASLGLRGLREVPVVGCDGTPDVGQAMVRHGTLAATVVLPRLAEAAVGAIARLLRNGRRPPPVMLLRGTPHPESLVRAREGALVA